MTEPTSDLAKRLEAITEHECEFYAVHVVKAADVSEDVEAILGKPKSVEEMLPRTMATLAAMREESSIAPEALSEGGE